MFYNLAACTTGLFVYMVSMLACHAREPGSIPGQTVYCLSINFYFFNAIDGVSF